MNKISTISLLKMQTIINNIIIVLEKNLLSIKENEIQTQQQKELIEYLIGKKENIISTLSKLINLSLKLSESSFQQKNNIVLPNIDIKIINKFLKKNID